MDEHAVREHAEAYCNALLASDIGRSAEEMSKELRANLGSIVGMLPLPLTEASIESIESTPTGYKAAIRLVGEHDTIRLETRWKDRDGRPTMVEASHIPQKPVEPDPETDETQE
ncbi:MAG: hypothetical protein WD116_05575 [Chloroflexota bacterium]